MEIDKGQLVEIYNVMSDRIKADLQDELNCKRINGNAYAQAYVTLMNNVITQSFGAIISLQTKETDMDRCVKQSQCDLNDAKKKAEDIKNGDLDAPDSIYEKNKDVLVTQKALLERQKEGYDDNKLQKLFDSQIKAWSVVFQDTDMTCVTPVIMNDAMVGIFNQLAPDDVDITPPYYPSGSDCDSAGTGSQ
jgi:hypothetical protein